MPNSLWASIRDHGYIPDRVYICSSKKNVKGASKNKERVSALLEGYDRKVTVSIVEIPENNFVEIGNTIADIVKREKKARNEVALDITSARKAIASPALIVADKYKADHIFYLYIEDVTNANRPYMMIPMKIQHSNDFLSGGKG
ncbi:MAG: hypothetical protein E3J35_07680 [Methanomassiliicoccales archaeon]|nr:MAG: hypothetical protein E3J35_07680 [Methanomassiliicoccales archaeon]